MHAWIKATLESMLGSSIAARISRGRLRGARLVLAYHDITGDDGAPAGGDASLHLPIGHFRAQLDAISETGLRVVAPDAPHPGHEAPPEVSITFDDAYAGTLDNGIRELRSRALPGTVFVAPGLLGCPAPWWDLLADSASGAVRPDLRNAVLSELGGDGEAILAHARERGWRTQVATPAFRIASERELADALAGHPGLSLGAHSWSHPNLAVISAARLEHELRAPLAWLRARWPDRVIPWLAYPYGLDSPAVNAATELSGYRGAFRVSGRWHRADAPPFTLPRLNVTPGLSVHGFRARLFGTL